MFFLWVDYVEKAETLGITEIMPERLITAYNELLEKIGEEPIIYEIEADWEDAYYHIVDNKFYFDGRFPCDDEGKPILKWIDIRVKNASNIRCTCEKSREGTLIIGISPDLIVLKRLLMKEDEKVQWYSYYIGPVFAEFNSDALRDYREELELTQKQVAEAIGTTERTYQRWEAGDVEPAAHYLVRLLIVLGINDVQSLIKYVGPKISEKEIESWV